LKGAAKLLWCHRLVAVLFGLARHVLSSWRRRFGTSAQPQRRRRWAKLS
jgi:hypothetical protein